jgi:hypothetical protein
MKKLAIFLFITLIHFGLSVLIIPMTMTVAGTLKAAQSMPTVGLKTLVAATRILHFPIISQSWYSRQWAATRILHFPIISQSWYSRQWFPGDWIRIPILINSLLWACGIYFLVIVFQKIRGRS